MTSAAEILTFNDIDSAGRAESHAAPLGKQSAETLDTGTFRRRCDGTLQDGLLEAIQRCPQELQTFVAEETAIQEQYDSALRSVSDSAAKLRETIAARETELGIVGRSVGALQLGSRFDERFAALKRDRLENDRLWNDQIALQRASELSRREVYAKVSHYLRKAAPRTALNMKRREVVARAVDAGAAIEQEFEWSVADIGRTDSVLAFRDGELRIGYPALAADAVGRVEDVLDRGIQKFDELAKQGGLPELAAAASRIRELKKEIFGEHRGEWGVSDELAIQNGAVLGRFLEDAVTAAARDLAIALESADGKLQGSIDGDVAIAVNAWSVGAERAASPGRPPRSARSGAFQ